jgi:hypothetical protein
MIKIEFSGGSWAEVLREVRQVAGDQDQTAAAAPTATSTPNVPRLRFSQNARRLLDLVATAGRRVYASEAATALGVDSTKGIAAHMSMELKEAGYSFDSLIRRDYDYNGTFYVIATNLPPELRAAAFPPTQASSAA